MTGYRINGKPIAIGTTNYLTQGGEADIYRLPGGLVAKIFKAPTHPDFKLAPEQQKLAGERIAEHQTKLPAFPKGLPVEVIGPQDLIHDDAGRIAGYTMPFVDNTEVVLQFGDRGYRTQHGVSHPQVTGVFRSMHRTVQALHGAKVVIGDFNDLNVLAQVGPKPEDNRAFFIDADSWQYGGFPSRVFTAQFLDPLVSQTDALMQNRPHSEATDWFAFAVMLFKSLLYVHPFGGVFSPKDKTRLVKHNLRALRRITVFDPEVRYPKPAIHWGVLPDDLLHHFAQVFEKDLRVPFPPALLERLIWQECGDCGTLHARSACPTCGQKGLGQTVEIVKVHGTVTATEIFRTTGTILMATMQKDRLRWLYYEGGALKREGGRTVRTGKLDQFSRFRIQGDNTLVGSKTVLETIRLDGTAHTQEIDATLNLAMFDANADRRFWTHGGYLQRDHSLGIGYTEQIGSVLSGKTMFWVGDHLGFGFYRASEIFRPFLFRPTGHDLLDVQGLPRLQGTLVDSTAVFGRDRVFFLTKTSEGSRTVNRCFAIGPDGVVLGSAEADDGSPGWLGSIRGKVVVGNNLLSATDEGIVRIEHKYSSLEPTRVYTDSEPFVDTNSHLFPGPNGTLYVVKSNAVLLLQIR